MHYSYHSMKYRRAVAVLNRDKGTGHIQCTHKLKLSKGTSKVQHNLHFGV